jgi:hypothetical protein
VKYLFAGLSVYDSYSAGPWVSIYVQKQRFEDAKCGNKLNFNAFFYEGGLGSNIYCSLL